MVESARGIIALQRAIADLPVPVVCRLDGAVRAGGLGLVASADVVVCRDDVTFALTEVRLGLAAAVISIPLRARLSPRAASDWFLTGRVGRGRRGPRAGPGHPRRAAPTRWMPWSTGCSTTCGPGARQGLVEAKRLLNADLVAAFDSRRRRDGAVVRAAVPLDGRPGADGRGPAPLSQPEPRSVGRGSDDRGRPSTSIALLLQVAAVGGAGQGWSYAVPPAPAPPHPACRTARSCRRTCCEALASSDDPHVAAHAQATLDVDAELRQSRRTVRPAADRTSTPRRRRLAPGTTRRPAARDPRRGARHHAAGHPRALRGRPRHRRPGGHRGLRRARRHLAAVAGGLRSQLARRQGSAAGRHRALRHQLRQRLLGRHPDGLRRRRRGRSSCRSPAASTSSATSSPTGSPSTPRA